MILSLSQVKMRRSYTFRVSKDSIHASKSPQQEYGRKMTFIAPIDRNSYEDFLIAKTQVKQFAGCGHICVPVSRNVDGVLYTDECRICASMYNGSQLESSIKRGKMKMLISIGEEYINYSATTINAYYCAHTNLHADSCDCTNTSCAPTHCRNKRKHAQLLPQTKSCSQVFFACEHDLFACSGERRGGILQCWNAHLSDEYPIYKCIVALLLVYGLRFDNALPIRETSVPIAYNSQLKIAIICYENERVRTELENILRTLGTRYIRTIYTIDYRKVNEMLPMFLFEHRRDFAVACDITEKMAKLARQIISCAKDRESLNTESSYSRIIEKIQSGQLIKVEDLKDDTIRALTIDDYKEHTELIKPTPCEYETIPNVRMRLARLRACE